MARIAGVQLPTKKRVVIALTYIHGIGNNRAKDIVSAVGISESLRVYDLSDDLVRSIREFIDANYTVEGDLRKIVNVNIDLLKVLGCYRGLRHRSRLPVRGQNTHNNARTARGGKGKVVANKKKAGK